MNDTTQILKTQQPKLIFCFGVSGCGKSTVASHLADKFNLAFIEADDFHPEVNKQHMSQGKPLTDAMREPWIDALCMHIKKLASEGKSCVMANSGLRRKHRQRFRELGLDTLYLHLHGPKEIIYQRMQSRQNHFMPPELLDSQFEALEMPQDENDVVFVDISESVPEIIAKAENRAKNFLTAEAS